MMGRTAAVAATVIAGLAATAAPASADGIRDSQWHLRSLDVVSAHRFSQGADVTVAVVDSGVDAIHPDLADNVLPGTNVTGSTDNSGRFDVDGRGTGLAGLIAGHGHGTGRTGPATQGADGVLGLAPRARVLPVAITTRPGQFGDPDVLADGIGVAVARGAKVICIGRGLPASPRLERAVADAIRADVIVVAPLANRRGEIFLPWPAAYPGVLAVTPLDRAGSPAVQPTASPSPASPSPATPSPGPAALGVPGVDLVTTDAGGGYRIDAGAGSAAIAAGAAALVRARYPELRGDEVARRLTATAVRQGALNVVAALTETVPTLAPAPTPSRTGAAAAPTTATAAAPATPRAGKAAFDTTDWHRWLVAVPLLAFVGLLIAYAVRGTRRRPAR